MGSTKPRATVPQVVYYYQPAPVDPAPETPADPEGTPEAVQKQREKNLLRRARSTLGTVLNGFRGILSSNDQSVPRKTLLGE